MPKRTFCMIDDAAETCLLYNIPLLRRLLTGEAALTQPGFLRCISRKLQHAVTAVMNDAGFWRDLTIRCMPNMFQLPHDVAYFLRIGRFGVPESPEAQNMAWRLNYMRIVKTFLHLRIYYQSPNASGNVHIVQYAPFHCNGADDFFHETAHCPIIQLGHGTEMPFRYDVNRGTCEPSYYRYTLFSGETKEILFGSPTMDISFKRRRNIVIIEMFTYLHDMRHVDDHLTRMLGLELPLQSSYGANRCTVTVKNDSNTDDKSIFFCHYAERAIVLIPRFLQNHEPGLYVLIGPPFRSFARMQFYWDGDSALYFEFFLMGDLANANGEIYIYKME